jgi:hypothetical protein
MSTAQHMTGSEIALVLQLGCQTVASALGGGVCRNVDIHLVVVVVLEVRVASLQARRCWWHRLVVARRAAAQHRASM